MHQITEIRAKSNIKDGNFISGVLNISEYCTQPLKLEYLAKPNCFLNGPKFFFGSLPLQSVFIKK